MAKKSLDPALVAILDSIRATVGSDAPPPQAAADAPAIATAPAPRQPIPQHTVEEFLAELIRPQVKAWLDARLPELVQQITAEEIARILDRG